MRINKEKPALEIYDSYNLEAIILYDGKVSKWFTDLCAGKEPTVEVDEEILAQLQSRGLIKKIDNYWVLGHDGREFARKLGLVTGAGSIEINPRQVCTEKLKDADIEKLWDDFFDHRKETDRNSLMQYYLHIVKNTAERIWVKLPDKVDLDDLVQAGIFGLMDAVDAFDPSRGIKFEVFCSPRIRGSILDELRSMDWVPRLVRARFNQLERANQELAGRLGRVPTDKELAEELQLSEGDFHRLHRDANAIGLVSLNNKFNASDGQKEVREVDIIEDQKSQNPVTKVQKHDLKNLLSKGLTHAEKLIVFLYYYEEMTMKEIGACLDMPESRISQMHSAIVARLRAQMNSRKDEFLSEKG